MPLVIAHRGSSAHAPENTLAAFRRAIDDGADAVELDIHLTKDGEVVVIHDAQLQRTTDGRGLVWHHTVKELQRLSAGSWFHRTFTAERIPTLDEVFTLLGGTIGINIEIKADSSRRQDFTIVHHCCEIVKKHQAERMVIISSFSESFIKRVKIIQPSIATALLYHPVRHLGRSPIEFTQRSNAEYLILNGSRIRKRLIRKAHERNILIGEYTVNTQWRVRRALRYGVDVLFTNDPSWLRKALSKAQK